MNSVPGQPEFPFKLNPRVKPKIFQPANGSKLPYWRLPNRKILVRLCDGALIDITRQSSGQSGHPRLYTKLPGQDGIVQARNLKTILAQIALLDQIRLLNKSIQVKLKQQDDAARALSDLTKENVAALQAENARLRRKLEALTAAGGSAAEGEGAGRQRSQSINVLGLRWAYEQKGLNVTGRATLMSFAIHADEGGFTWPSVDRIASTWNMDRDTVRKQIGVLLGRRLLFQTDERRGFTGQVKVYRLPELICQSGGKSPLFGDSKAVDKRGTSGGESILNSETVITEQAKACRLPVQEPTTGYRPAIAGLDEQMDRLERILEHDIGFEQARDYLQDYRAWWRKYSGKSGEHLKALRQTLDDYVTNRKTVHFPKRWIVKTFKKKVQAIHASR
jgi:hypothetical protein